MTNRFQDTGFSLCTRALAATLLVAVALPLEAQTTRTKKRFEGRTEVIEVQVPVNVIMRSGEPVRGLTADDFKVTEKGREFELTGFEVVDLEMLSPDLSPRQMNDEIPAAARRHVLLLFDLAFSDLSAVVRAREAARNFVLNSLHPSDLVAVGTHSVETGPRLIITFTPDRVQLGRAIDTLGAPRLLDLHGRDPLSFLIETPGYDQVSLDSSEGIGGATSDVEAQVANHLRVLTKQFQKIEKSYARGRVFSWAKSMGDMARMLDSVQGRKHIVYFSEGFDGRLLLGRQPDASDTEAQADLLNLELGRHWMVDTDDIYGSTALQADVQDMLFEFQRADCVIQAVNIAGLRADRPDEMRGREVGEQALFYMANETGGSYFEETNDFSDHLVTALNRSAVTYLLSFTPTDIVPDGSFHRIKIDVNAPKGSQVSHRRGYYAPRPFEDLHPLEKNLLAADSIASAEVREEIEVDVLVAPFKAGEDMAYVPVIVEIDGGSLLQEHDDPAMPVEIYAYATDARGEMRDFFTQLVTLQIGDDRKGFRERGLKYYGHLDLPSGEHLVRVLVRNGSTGARGVQAMALEIPEFGSEQPVVLPAFFPEVPNSWNLAREQRGEYESSVVYPFTVNGQPYIPAARANLNSTGHTPLYIVAYNLGDEDEIAFDGRVVSSGGEVVDDATLASLQRTTTGISGLHKLVATFDPSGLAAGDYLLELTVRDREGVRQTNHTPFTVLN